MPSQRMPDANSSAQSQLLRNQGSILPKPPPIIGFEVFVALPVTPQIDGKTVPIRQVFDNAVPDASVKTGGVGEQNRRPGTRPLPYGQFFDAKQMHVQ